MAETNVRKITTYVVLGTGAVISLAGLGALLVALPKSVKNASKWGETLTEQIDNGLKKLELFADKLSEWSDYLVELAGKANQASDVVAKVGDKLNEFSVKLQEARAK